MPDIEFENNGRDVLIFNVSAMRGRKGFERPVVTKRFVIGDKNDADGSSHIAQHGRDPALAPNPRASLSVDEWLELGPENQRVLRHYIGNGTVRVIRGQELIAA
jgi:hypothetical protein